MAESMADNTRVVIAALAAAELTPDEAATILRALASQTRIIEVDEIEKRIAALEQEIQKGPNVELPSSRRAT